MATVPARALRRTRTHIFLKEQEESDRYKEVVKLYTDDDTLLDALKNNEGDEKSAASEIIKGMKEWIEDGLGEGKWNEDEALEVLKNSGKANEGETLQDVIKGLIGDAKSTAENI